MTTQLDIYYRYHFLKQPEYRIAAEINESVDNVHKAIEGLHLSTGQKKKLFAESVGVKEGEKFNAEGHTWEIIKLYNGFALCSNGMWRESFSFADLKQIKNGTYNEMAAE